uniref:Excision repair cross-complementation group 6-like 2 n=1 Tax=Scophthalmus maximus TaxID=52904 RepID=A0A8D3CQV3_SCOMX
MDQTSPIHCLAPNPKDGTLKEAIIQRLTSTLHSNDSTAWVIFTDCNRDEKKEEEEEVAIPVSNLMRPDLNEFTQEKPVFPSIITEPRLCVPLELSDADGDRVPYTINRYLRDYQREGIRFIYNNYTCPSGCILGDDMGLGKTVQVIGFLAAVLHKTGTWEDTKKNRPQFLQSQIPSKQSKPNKVFLIVAPLSVLYNWKDELDAWGHFQCVVVHGLRKEEELARIKKGRVEIALTTYETLRLCLDQFNNIDWSAVVVDEAHKIKNPSSQITQAMKELKCKVRIGLTGTILQNNLEELWCVMDWAIPRCLGSLGNFKNKFSDPIEQGQRHSATKRALATARKSVRALVRKISHWFLRRTKSLIKDQLPKKNDRVVYCSLTEFQQTVYQTVLDSEDVTLMLRSSEKCDCQSGRTRRSCCYEKNSEGVPVRDLYFSYLAILRKVANHVALLQSPAGTSKKQEKYLTTICQKVFQKFPDFVRRCKDEAFEALSDPMYSGKMKVQLRNKDKVLLFSLSTKLLDVLESYCMAEGLDYSRLDGTTKSKERLHIVKEFNSSSHTNICLVSTMAGGLGLNFVGANVVVLFDPTWNPANDLQAIDRAYRIGQCRDVTVLRLISLGTVEEVIYLRQVYKQQLQCSVVGKESSRRYFEAVQGHIVHKGELFGLKNLFRLQTQGTCLTRKILEREGQVEAGVITTSTNTGEEKEDGGKGVGVSNSAVLTEPEHGALVFSHPSLHLLSQAAHSPPFSHVNEGIPQTGIFLSVSQTTHKGGKKAVDGSRSGNATTAPGQMSLIQHGFSRLLERVKGRPEMGEDAEESRSDTDAEDHGISLDVSSDSDGEDGVNGAGAKKKRVSLLKESEFKVNGGRDVNSSPDKKANKLQTSVPTVHCFEGHSDESEDFDLEESTWPTRGAFNSHSRGRGRGRGTPDCNRKRQTTSARNKARSKYTEVIETFTSSEEEHTPVKKGRSTGGHFLSPQTDRSRVDMTKVRMKSPPSAVSRRNDGMIDNVLGGVQEVVYTHSNQRVVGGSRAEELISRAAVRDVFERKMYSQLPANHLLDIPEVIYCCNIGDEKGKEGKKSHCLTHCCAQIIFHSPLSLCVPVCRQHMEEMAEKLNFPSVHQFALEILRRNSSQRLAWLRQYYTSLNHPDLANAVTKNFPQSDLAQASSISGATSSKSHTEGRARQRDVPKATKKPKKNPDPKTKPEIPLNNFSVPQKKAQILQNDFPDPQTHPTNPQNDVPEPQKKDTPSSPDLSHGRSAMLSKPTARGREREQKSPSRTRETFQGRRENSQTPSPPDQAASASSNRSFLTDLIGDTSILDDLLKPKPRSAQQIPLHTDSGTPKGGRKDFWDILHEGNEESINRLTDPAEVQRVCVNANFSARSKSRDKEGKSLWKTNDKFLWKK